MYCKFAKFPLFRFTFAGILLLLSLADPTAGDPPRGSIAGWKAQIDLELLPGDFDGNGYVDASDYFEFFLRHDGPDVVPAALGWETLDSDADEDVDLRDLCILQNSFTSQFVRFTNPSDPTFSTLDVYDVHHEVVRFHGENRSIVWAATGTAYHQGSWAVNGNLLAGGGFQVRFGTSGGQPGAYFTETVPATVCDISVFGGNLLIFATNVPVPQN